MTSPDADHQPAPLETLLTVPEACAALRVSKWTLYELIRSRRLQTVKINARRLIPATSLQRFVAELQTQGAE